MNERKATITRQSKETDITVNLNLDGSGEYNISTGIGFLDHMLSSLALCAGFDLELTCIGDLQVDDHHSVEDSALSLGKAIDKALGNKIGIARFGYAFTAMDESLARAVIDLSGRPSSNIELALQRERIGSMACENISHWFSSLAYSAKMSIHIDVLKGQNDHHRAEASAKALGLAFKMALRRETSDTILSTKGVL